MSRVGMRDADAPPGGGPFYGADLVAALAAVPPEVRVLVDRYLAEHPGGRERLIPLLHHVQQALGHLPYDVQDYVADRLGLAPVEVHGVVSFYHFFTTVPRGRFPLKVCMGTACFVRRSERIVDAVRELLGIDVGGTTEDGLFSLEQVRCIGACGLAPAMMVGDEVHGHLDRAAVRKLLRRLRRRAREERDG